MAIASNLFKHRRRGKEVAVHASAALPSNDLAIVFDDAQDCVVLAAFGLLPQPAVFSREAGAIDVKPIPGIHTVRLPLTDAAPETSLAAKIGAWRESIGLLPAANSSAFLIAPDAYSERTRIYPLDDESLALDDAAIVGLLVRDAETKATEQDGHPLFDEPLDEIVCDISRLPNGTVTLTEVPRADFDQTARRVFEITQADTLLQTARDQAADDDSFDEAPTLMLGAETYVRAVLRYFLQEEYTSSSAAQSNLVTAIFIATSRGSLIGFWSPTYGLFDESGERFALDLSSESVVDDDVSELFDSTPTEPQEIDPAMFDALRDEALEFAVGKLGRKLNPARLEELGFSGVERILWAASLDAEQAVRLHLDAYCESADIAHVAVSVPLEEAVARGLLWGSLSESSATDVPARVPSINLADEFRARAVASDTATELHNDTLLQSARNSAVLALTAPLVAVLAFLFVSWLDTLRDSRTLAHRAEAASVEAARLKPIADARVSAEGNLNWFVAYIGQIIELRRRQGAAIGLYHDLDARWPLRDDPSFYVSEMKTNAAGVVEIKGFTRHEESFTAFERSLEFSGTDEQGRKIFTNIAYDVRQGGAAVTPGANVPAAISSSGGVPPPGVVAWTVRGIYTPLASNSKPPTPVAAVTAPAVTKPTPPALTNSSTGAPAK